MEQQRQRIQLIERQRVEQLQQLRLNIDGALATRRLQEIDMDEKKLRAEFEAWVRRTVVDATETDFERDGEIYEWDRLNMAFAAWKASREALVIELPHRRPVEFSVIPAEAIAFNDSLRQCGGAIEAAGIRTK